MTAMVNELPWHSSLLARTLPGAKRAPNARVVNRVRGLVNLIMAILLLLNRDTMDSTPASRFDSTSAEFYFTE
jgi:hypothetical protein